MNLQYIRELWVNSQEGERDVGRSAAVIFGVPTCVGNMSWQVKSGLAPTGTYRQVVSWAARFPQIILQTAGERNWRSPRW